MASFPGAIVSLTNPTTTDKMVTVSHAAQHSAANDEIEAIETALGAGLANVLTSTVLDTDTTLSADSDSKVATQKATKAYVDATAMSGGGIPIGYLDTDGTLATNSDVKVATQKATKTYVDAHVSGLRVKVGSFTRDLSAASGDTSVTGVGFPPKAIIFFAGPSATPATGAASYGVTDGTTSGGVEDRSGTSVGQTVGISIAIAILTTTGTAQEAVLKTLDTDGFTLTWTKSGSPTGTCRITYLALG